MREYGVHESPSPNDSNPRVLQYFAASGNAWVKDDTNNAWCSGFIGFVAATAGLQKTGSLLARSWLNAGQAVTIPSFGNVAVFWRDDIKGTHGHVALFVREDDDGQHIWVLGGNQADAVDCMKFPKSQLLGYRDITKPWLAFSFQSNLKQGASGDDVKKLQEALNKIVAPAIAVDGDFGPDTKQALVKFQRGHGLDADGVVGPFTRAELNKLV